ncbi:hypothetical protein Y032_0015g2539 [Ancylostoma ceylanicum]|uniref:Uncharacterized protein n=1 Tax=Ancylostoma ceylanicum TaxID=53326 RepID=A0A016V6D8_9BILA|nr:hypothetical protein Y032_0015g2539 [Ancylostoma ceylanicum]
MPRPKSGVGCCSFTLIQCDFWPGDYQVKALFVISQHTFTKLINATQRTSFLIEISATLTLQSSTAMSHTDVTHRNRSKLLQFFMTFGHSRHLLKHRWS